MFNTSNGIILNSGPPPALHWLQNYPINTVYGQAAGSLNAEVPLGPLMSDDATTNRQCSIKSTNANDTIAGTGLRQVKITYLDQNFAGPFTEIMDMNGTTIVATSNSNICYIENIEGYTVGSGLIAAGNLVFYLNSTGAGTSLGTINTAEQGLGYHWVPAGKTCFITSISAQCYHSTAPTTATDGGQILLKYRYGAMPWNFSASGNWTYTLSDAMRVVGLQQPVAHNYLIPIRVEGPAKVGLNCIFRDTVGTNSRYAGSFSYFEL